jgi:DNA-binding MarR family transcriptional regulator
MEATNPELRELAEALTFLVENAYRGMARTFDVTRVGLLKLAGAGSPIRPTDAAEALDVARSTVTRYAATLESEGLVSVVGDPGDGRSCLISVTDRGREELGRFEAAGVEIFAGVLHDWSADDVRKFAELINRLATAWADRGPERSRPARALATPRWRTRTAGAPT